MLEPVWITVVTIAGGSVVTLVCWALTALRSRDYLVPFELWTGYLINSLTLVTLGCFIYNICFVVMNAAIERHQMDGLKIEGNEALIFWMFVYSFGQAALSLRRSILSVARK